MIWFTSDFHFGHENIIKYCNRPFSSVEEMDEALIRRWNDTVGVDDEVFFLGDFSMSPKVIDLVGLLNGDVHLIAGNHDSCWKKGRLKEAATQRFLDAGFDSVATSGEITIGNRTLLMSHFPFERDARHGDRYAEFAPKDNGEWLLCGHVHDSWKVQRRQINVGIDAWGGRLVSTEDIAEVMSGGTTQEIASIRW